MSTHQNNDGSFSTLADTSRTFEYEWQAQAHEESLNQPSTQQQSAQSYSSPGPGIIAVLIACKPFYPVLMLYWFIAFPAINASWLLRTAGFPFSWLGNIMYYPWMFVVKAVGAPYYLAYLFGDVASVFLLPVIAIIWFFVLSIVVGKFRESRPVLYKKIFRILAIAAATPVVLAILAFLVGSLRGDVVQVFWYGHDPYTYPVWEFINRQTLNFVYPGIER